MTPIQALETAIVNVLGSWPSSNDERGGRIMRQLCDFGFTVAPRGWLSAPAAIYSFAHAILHGDAEHRAWLLEAAVAFNEGRPLPPPRNAKGVMNDADSIRNVLHWNKVGPGTPLGVKLETMHQNEYSSPYSKDTNGRPTFNLANERGVTICHARILVVGDDIEWIDQHGYSTLVNPGSFKAPTHWRWMNGSGGT